jgi:hypothetical protein
VIEYVQVPSSAGQPGFGPAAGGASKRALVPVVNWALNAPRDLLRPVRPALVPTKIELSQTRRRLSLRAETSRVFEEGHNLARLVESNAIVGAEKKLSERLREFAFPTQRKLPQILTPAIFLERQSSSYTNELRRVSEVGRGS